MKTQNKNEANESSGVHQIRQGQDSHVCETEPK